MTTKHAPFEVLMGFLPKGHQVFRQSRTGRLLSRLNHISQLCQEVELNIKHAQELAIKGSKFKPFTEGQEVWLDATHLKTTHPVTKLRPKRYGPFKVTKAISHVAYKLDLPPTWKIHNVFHVTLLSPYKETPEHGRNFPAPPPDLIDGQEEWEVERVVGMRHFGRKKKLQYRVRWKGYAEAHDSWESADDIHAPDLVTEFLQGQQTTTMVRSIKTLPFFDQEQMSAPPSRTNSPTFSDLYQVQCTNRTPDSFHTAELNDAVDNDEDAWNIPSPAPRGVLTAVPNSIRYADRLRNVVLDSEAAPTLGLIPRPHHPITASRVRRDLHLGILSPADIQGNDQRLHPVDPQSPSLWDYQGLLARTLLREDEWNRAALAVPDHLLRIPSPTPSSFSFDMSSSPTPSSPALRYASTEPDYSVEEPPASFWNTTPYTTHKFHVFIPRARCHP